MSPGTAGVPALDAAKLPGGEAGGTSMRFSSRVPASMAGRALIEYLTRRFTYHTRESWTSLVESGRILVDGEPATCVRTLAADDEVTFCVPPFEEPEADCAYRIVYEDEWVLGIDKPGNLLVHRAGKSVTRNLAFLLRQGRDGRSFPEAGPVHRLDRGTSGVVIVAKTPAARAPLQRAFATGCVEKEYAALVRGALPAGTVTVDRPIGPDADSGIGYKHRVDEEHGKRAVTRFEVVRRVGTDFSLVRAFPQTGRTHQIRVHLAWLGCPCVGDALYAMDAASYRRWRDDPECGARPLELPRQALHCARVSFQHPFTARSCAISAPLAEDMARFMAEQEAED